MYSCRHSWTAVARAVRVNRIYKPNPMLHAQYAEKVAVYAEVYPALGVKSEVEIRCLSWLLSQAVYSKTTP